MILLKLKFIRINLMNIAEMNKLSAKNDRLMWIITNRIEVGEQYENKYRISSKLSIHDVGISICKWNI